MTLPVRILPKCPISASKNIFKLIFDPFISWIASWNKIKVYTEGFRVPVLNRRAIGCKSLNLYPIVWNLMKNMFFLWFTTPVGALLPKCKILFEHARRLWSCDFFDVIYSTSRLVYNMDECRISGKAEFNAIFLRLRWKLEDFDQMAGWGPV